ncbi:hypothetical protein CC78DRAFT_527951 [Lojkania enalia]|uniref:SET domain-containing protein n=1 Tax=Lojkania enalia TaxID=147567 RepID=A0A9P4TRU5_9PLEO|nr:hypothetical protein CC78DRAFT_527951 [Didymosphaeria enalia]
MDPLDTHVNKILHERLAELKEVQANLADHPYSIPIRLRLAVVYRKLGYPDLAVGDAYKALLLVDEVIQEGEYHDRALGAAQNDISSGRAFDSAEEIHSSYDYGQRVDCCCQQISSTKVEIDEAEVARWSKICWPKSAYAILIGGLIDCGCLRSAFDYNSRATTAFPKTLLFTTYQKVLNQKLRSYFEAEGEDLEEIDVQEYPDKGFVRRELYPWNKHEPDRFSSESLEFLNGEMQAVAPKLEVKISNLPILTSTSVTTSVPIGLNDQIHYVKQLGVFAKERISPGELILQEKSLLTSVSRLHDLYCDACSASLPELGELNAANSPITCEDCNEVFFCSVACQDSAQAMYHPSLCGLTIEEKVPASEAADSLYTLLLVRSMALAETQDLHPLELREVRYVWGDYHGHDLDTIWKTDSKGSLADPFGSVPRTLPFSFTGNIIMPLHVLEKMDINIFEQSDRYDTWVFNTLYAKFRGTASARQGPDGRPELGAVHPMWCLANHSCDPNVTWEWQGNIKFWAKGTLVDWKGRGPTARAGLHIGEEVLSHYCDIRLPFKERREWAVGALGGQCMCPRCVWEEAEEVRMADTTE